MSEKKEKEPNPIESSVLPTTELALFFTEKGWYIKWKKNITGPYPTLEDINVRETSSVLDISVEKLAKLIFRVSLTRYKSEDRPTPRVFTFEDGTELVPDLEGQYIGIHPAIDFKRNEAFIGLWKQTRITKTVKKGEIEEKKVSLKPILYLVISNKDFFPVSEDELLKRDLYLIYKPYKYSSRWNEDGFNQFLESKIKVTPKQVFETIRNQLKIYMDFVDPRHYNFISLWKMGTYFFHLFKSYPYLYIGGTKRVGKTKLLIIASFICFNALNSASISTASIFRTIQNTRGTLLIDETEKLHSAERNPELRAVLLGGFINGTYAYRVEGDKTKYTQEFDLYSPKMLANILGIEDVLEDRCITIFLLRSMRPDIKGRWPSSDDPVWAEIRNMLYMLYMDYAATTCDAYHTCDTILERAGITGREKLLWQPIITIAKMVEDDGVPGLVEEIIQLAKESMEKRDFIDMAENTDVILVDVLREICGKDDFYYIKDIRNLLVQSVGEERVLKNGTIAYDAPKWLTNSWVGRALRRLGFDEGRRVGTGPRQIRLTPEKVENVALRLTGGVSMPTKTVVSEMASQASQVSQVVEEKLPERIEVSLPTFEFKTPLISRKDEDHKEEDTTCVVCNQPTDKLYPDKNREFFVCAKCRQEQEEIE